MRRARSEATLAASSADEAPAARVPPDAEARWWGAHLSELRWPLEAARLAVDPVLRGQGIERGDGRPVVLVPGFLAGDQTLSGLALWLRRIGYRPALTGFVLNVDCSERALQRLAARIDELRERHGRRVAVIGHSRGSHFARALAVRRPQQVSHAISLGGGLNRQLDISAPTTAAVAVVRGVHRLTTDRLERRGCMTEACGCEYNRDFQAPFPESVRLTSVYSRSDGVVRWRSCVVPYADCVEVESSHVGMVFNRDVYRAIADALAEPELDAPADRAGVVPLEPQERRRA